MIEPPLLRIGELSRRLGVGEPVLRPVRAAGGCRLSSEADLQRIRRMQAFLSYGVSASEAARAAVMGESSQPAALVEPASGLAAEATTLARALDGYDETAAQAAL